MGQWRRSRCKARLDPGEGAACDVDKRGGGEVQEEEDGELARV